MRWTRLNVTCEFCGHRQQLARAVAPHTPITLTCHDCENLITVDWTAWKLTHEPTAAYSARAGGLYPR